MKLYRALTAMVLAATISATIAAVANGGVLPSGSVRLGGGVAEPRRTMAATSTVPARPSSATRLASNRVLVRLKADATPRNLTSLARSIDTTVGGVSDIHHGRLQWRIPRGRSAQQFAAELKASGQVVYAVPDYRRELTAYTPPAYVVPNDPAFASSQTWHFTSETFVDAYSWWLRDIHAPQAWQEGYTGTDIVGKHPLRADGDAFTVDVLDSGLYTAHPDTGVDVVGGFDFFDHEDSNGMLVTDNDVTPVNPADMPSSIPLTQRRLEAAHGTCVSGEIGATGGNALGTIGVGYDTRVIVHKVMGVFYDGDVSISDGAVIDAIQRAVDVDHAKVISMSFGGPEYSDALADAINYAHAHGVVVVAAKGNNASGQYYYPADNDYVLSVGALDKNVAGATVPANFTNYRMTGLDIMAPGAFIYGLCEPGWDADPEFASPGYYLWDGTSMATPIVAGAIAWLWRAAPSLSADEIESEVINSGSVHGATTHFPHGYRELDMYAAYRRLESEYPLLGKPTVPGQSVATLGNVTLTWDVPQNLQRDVTYDVDLDGSRLETATFATWGTYGVPVGDHTLSVAAHSAYNWDDGSAVTTAHVNVVALTGGASSWSAAHVYGGTATAVNNGYQQSVGFEATLFDAASAPLAGATPRLQSSPDGSEFTDVDGADLGEDPGGSYFSFAAPSRLTYYRFAFETTGSVTGSESPAFCVKPHAWVSTPSAKSTVRHTSRLAVNGSIAPARATGSHSVKLLIKRWNGRRWASYSSVWTSVRYHETYSSYSASRKLRVGKYRIYAYTTANALNADGMSGYRSVTVK